MDFFTSTAQWYADHLEFIPIVLTAGFILVIMGIVLFFFQDKLIHGITIGVTVAIFFALQFNTSAFGQELYLNISVALAVALLTWFFSSLAMATEGWTMSIAIASIVGVALLFLVDVEAPRSNVFLTLATLLTGAVISAFLIREDWEWSPQKRGEALREAIRKERRANKREGTTGDYYILIVGRDAADAAQKLEFLHDSNISTYDEQEPAYDKETGFTFQQVQANIVTTVKEEEVVFLNNLEARLRLLAYPDTAKKIYKQLGEVLEITHQQRIEWHSEDLVHLELRTMAPKGYFSQYLEKQIYDLSVRWRESDEEHLQQSIEALLQWAQDMQFIKK